MIVVCMAVWVVILVITPKAPYLSLLPLLDLLEKAWLNHLVGVRVSERQLSPAMAASSLLVKSSSED
jgi:hypothetical protein